MRTKQILLGLSVILLFCSPGLAQVNDKEKAQQEVERRQELQRKTFGLLDGIVAEAWGLKLPENRAFVLTNVADLLWARDEKRARNLFWDALNSLGLTAHVPVSNPALKEPAGDKIKSQSQYYATFAVRQEFLLRVAQHDPELALEMLRAMRQPPAEPPKGGVRPPDDRELEQEIAGEAALRDPNALCRSPAIAWRKVSHFSC